MGIAKGLEFSGGRQNREGFSQVWGNLVASE